MTSKRQSSPEISLGSCSHVKRTESPSPSTVSVPITPTSLHPTPRIKFPVDCDLAHFYQDLPQPSTAHFSLLPPKSTPPLPFPCPSPSDAPTEHIPRPPNAFMLFRSDFLKRDVIPPSVEKRQQTLSRIAGEVWNLMPAQEKKEWHEKSAEALRLHNEKYPNYKFSPARRGNGRKSKVKAAKEGNNDRIREIRETYLHMRGPAVAPSRRRRGKQQAPTSKVESTGHYSDPSINQPVRSELNLTEPREHAPPPIFPRPTYPHIVSSDNDAQEKDGMNFWHYSTISQDASTVENWTSYASTSRLTRISDAFGEFRTFATKVDLSSTTISATISPTTIFPDLRFPPHVESSSTDAGFGGPW